MKIEIRKMHPSQHTYTLTRADGTKETIALDTKTYLLHDICHFVVEKQLQYPKGFWGMLARGHTFNALFGKDNPMTTELRFIEQIVGPVQSVHSGHMVKKDLGPYLKHLDFTLAEHFLDTLLAEIGNIMAQWKKLEMGQQLTLEWTI